MQSMSTLGQPCDICGDIGFAQAIVTCFNCHKSREHIYCMRPNFSSLPESWCCDQCQCSAYHYKKCHFKGSIQSEQEVEDLSIKENVCVMGTKPSEIPHATKMGDTRMQKGSFNSNLLPTPNTTSPGNFHVYKSTGHPEFLTGGRVLTSTPDKQNHELSQPLHGFKSSLKYPSVSLTTENFGSVEIISTKGKLHISDEAQHSPLKYNWSSVNGVKEKSRIDKKLLGMDKQTGKMASLVSKDCVSKEKHVGVVLRCQGYDTFNSKRSFKFGEEDLPNPPAVKALWKGSFSVLDFGDELYDGVEAYPPGKLSRKVCLVLKEMPTLLHFKLKPRLQVWPNTFSGDSPSSFDIALYFWADDLCRENYNHLMERMVKNDLCIVSCLNGAELLIFTSIQLPVESQKLNRQFYLWGVFKALEGRRSYVDMKVKRALNFPLASSGIGEDLVTSDDHADLVVDMKVDMMERKETGSAGICMTRKFKFACTENSDIPSQDAFTKKRSVQSRFDVPPEFQRQVALERRKCSVNLNGKQHLSDAPVLNSGIHRDSAGLADKIADKEPIATPLVTVSTVHHEEDASAGFYKSTKQAEGDSPAKRQMFKTHQQEVLMLQASVQKQEVVIEQSSIQQQQSMHPPALLPFSQVESTSSENIRPGFDQPSLLRSSEVELIPNGKLRPGLLPSMVETILNGNLQTGFVQPSLLPCSNVEPISMGNLQPGFVQSGLLSSSRVGLIPNQNMWTGFVQTGLLPSSYVEPIAHGNMCPGFGQPDFLQAPPMMAIQSRNLYPGFYQTETFQSGNATPVFYQPSVLPSPHMEMSSGVNLYAGFNTSTRHGVYVSNVPLQVTEPLLQEMFRISGAIESCKLSVKGESSCGFVNYYDHQSAEHAILTLNGKELFGQPMKVSWAIKPLPKGAVNIFVGDLCPEVTDADLFAFFSVLPSCLAARVVRDHINGLSKLYGFVSFGNQQDAQGAIHNFNGKWLGGRQIKCNWATTKGSGSVCIQHNSDAINVLELQ